MMIQLLNDRKLTPETKQAHARKGAISRTVLVAKGNRVILISISISIYFIQNQVG